MKEIEGNPLCKKKTVRGSKVSLLNWLREFNVGMRDFPYCLHIKELIKKFQTFGLVDHGMTVKASSSYYAIFTYLDIC